MIGTRVGSYEVTQEIGDGGHAFVFKGVDGDSVVAIKMLKPSAADEDNIAKRFAIEAEALKELNHPGIVGFMDYIRQEEYHFLILEYMDQGSAEDLVETMHPIPDRFAVPIFYSVLDGIRHAHEQGYIHRDIKPSNILLNSAGEAKLTDFGIAKVIGGQKLTQQGFVVGTTLYMAPEFLSKGVVNVRTDIYSLGVTLYEMLTTRKPFEFESDNEPLISFAKRFLRSKPTPPSTYRPIHPQLERIVMKALSMDPKQRYKSAKDFRRDLEKHFPDLVKRSLLIESQSAKTGMIRVEEIQAMEHARDSVGSTTRSKAAPFIVAGLLVVGALLAHSIFGVDKWLAYGIGFILAIVFAVALTRRSRGIQLPEPLAPVPGPDVGDDDSSFSDILSSRGGDDDTIPFHDGLASKGTFQMTAESELDAYLLVLTGAEESKRYGLRPVSRIGRDLRVDIRPHDPEISRHHAVVTFNGRGFTAEDLGSMNGTYVNEERLQGKRDLNDGDILRVGSTSMRFESGRFSADK